MPKFSTKVKILSKRKYRSLVYIRKHPSTFNIITRCECKSKATTKKAMGLFCIEIFNIIFSFYLNGHNVECFKCFPANKKIFPFPLTGVLAYSPNFDKLLKAMKFQVLKYGINYAPNTAMIQGRCFKCCNLLFVPKNFLGTEDESELICNKCA